MTRTKKYRRTNLLKLSGEKIADVEASTGDSVRITLKDGTFILISPQVRQRSGRDLLIEVFPNGVASLVELGG